MSSAQPLPAARAPAAFAARLRHRATLTEASLAALDLPFGAERDIEARTDIVARGSPAGALNIIVRGWACRYATPSRGRRQIVSLLLPGDVCDLDALYLGTRDYGVEALTACSVATLDAAELRDLAADRRPIGELLGHLFAVENAMLIEQAVSLGRRSARAHLAHLFCELQIRLSAVGEGGKTGYDLPLTQEEIADLLGLSYVHLNRVLQQLRRDGLVEWQGQRVRIADWQALAAEADFDPGYLHLDKAEIPLEPAGSNEGDSAEARVEPEGEREQRELLNSELRHRFRNIVAVTQALVDQTLRGQTSIDKARESLERRLMAMGTAIDTLLRSDWQAAPLRETIDAALSRPADLSGRIHCSGPDFDIGSNATMALSLALHELHTNAMKHGSLSVPGGVVELFWKRIGEGADARLWMQWAEKGGPPARPPQSKGLGTRLISTATARMLGGEVELDYTPGGFTWLLVAPLDRLRR